MAENSDNKAVSTAGAGIAINASAVDEDHLASLRRLGEGSPFFDALIADFESDAERCVMQIAEALASMDYPALRSAVHALEGNAREVGAVGLANAVCDFRALKPLELASPRARELIEVLQQVLLNSLARIKASQSSARNDQTQ